MLTTLKGDRRARFLLLIGVFAPITMMVIIIVVGQITPGYNPISDTISQMGTPSSPYSMVLNIGYFVFSLLIGVTAYGFYRRLCYAAMSKTLAILLGIHAFGIVLMMVFPDSPDFAGKRFTDDILHNIFSAISFSALFAGILVFTRIARHEPVLKFAIILGLVVIILNLPLPVINMFGPFKPISGLLQRLSIALSFSWLAVTSLLLYKNHDNAALCRYGNYLVCRTNADDKASQGTT
ncbi:DUF998 domain-containing protein [Chloroflexota bacterium]